ncbi:MAG: hypothetical protein Q8N23_01570 [Archangium sp.]|nr:hypothetical protein [Archangium sp.]MDP3151327.1 hypothetical protein [Archangium sp.]MDP3571616.1 hypothetical protein [Archangium sp.]
MLGTGSSASAAVVVESAPLWVVADMVQAGQYEVVVVLNEDQVVLGLLRSDAVLRLSPRLPEAPVRMLPLQRVVEVKASVSLREARQILQDHTVDALLIEKPLLQGWIVMLRETVLAEAEQLVA